MPAFTPSQNQGWKIIKGALVLLLGVDPVVPVPTGAGGGGPGPVAPVAPVLAKVGALGQVGLPELELPPGQGGSLQNHQKEQKKQGNNVKMCWERGEQAGHPTTFRIFPFETAPAHSQHL